MTYSDLEEELDDMAADLHAARVKLSAVRALTRSASFMIYSDGCEVRVVDAGRLLAILDGPAEPHDVEHLLG